MELLSLFQLKLQMVSQPEFLHQIELLLSKLLRAKDAKPSDLVQPGHIFPLRASEGGVLSRAGHTEALVTWQSLQIKGRLV